MSFFYSRKRTSQRERQKLQVRDFNAAKSVESVPCSNQNQVLRLAVNLLNITLKRIKYFDNVK